MFWLMIVLALLSLPSLASAQDIIGPQVYPPGINPLTGLPVPNPEILNRRPMGVKVSNSPAIVRPQYGLNSADIVWEHLLEGGVTRFTAFFLSEDVPRVGPIRSARLVDIPLAHIYGSFLAYSGMSTGTLDSMRADPVMISRLIDNRSCPPMCRIPREGVAFEHTLFGETAGMYVQAQQVGRNTTPDLVSGMAFSELPPSGGVSLNALNVIYRNAETGWEYDPFSGRWLRSQNGEEHFDALSGSRISAANVAIVEANHIEQPFTYDGYWGNGNFAYAADLIGSGRLYLLRDGQYFTGQWRRSGPFAPLTFVDANGVPLPFKPGNTFFNLVPRWVDGYQLEFFLSNAPNGNITVNNANLRTGPGQAYRNPTVAQAGASFPVIGRNNVGDWVQVLLPDDSTLWVSTSIISLNGFDALTLPISRPSNER